jgi:hypothetical protein
MDCTREAADSPGGMARERQRGESGSARAARPGHPEWRLLRARAAANACTGPGRAPARGQVVSWPASRQSAPGRVGAAVQPPLVGAEAAQQWERRRALLEPAATVLGLCAVRTQASRGAHLSPPASLLDGAPGEGTCVDRPDSSAVCTEAPPNPVGGLGPLLALGCPSAHMAGPGERLVGPPLCPSPGRCLAAQGLCGTCRHLPGCTPGPRLQRSP